ncbi:MAG: DUF349 domain-containing protein [Pseudomonadota bacterium]|nr:DUF349 domain-containing protein [Pseudomonadota bacterium]
MFQFLFRRSGDKASTPAPAPVDQAPAAPTLRDSQSAALRALGDDEAAVVAFILQSDFAELRLAAAAKVHTRAALEQVHGAMRNVDRRVAKLVQGRLDALRHQDAETVRARAIVDDALLLVDAPGLTPNQVAELDRRWAVIRAPQLASQFDAARATLGARLDAQVQLQRAMIDRLGALRKLDASDLGAADLQQQLTQMNDAHATALASPERGSLPRNLIAEFEREMARVQATTAGREKQQAALSARSAALDAWEAVPADTLQAGALRREWQALPAAGSAGQQARFDALLAAAPAPPATTVKPEATAARPGAAKGADRPFLDALDAMEAALEQGSLGSAAELDKALKDGKTARGLRLTSAQADRLAHVRAELKRLSDWARWGGNVSREELIKAVDQMATQSLPMAELDKKVGSMRERWKALDSLSGAAPKTLWERFDAACSMAYAPAAAHFRQLAEERHANAATGQTLLDEARAEIARLQEDSATQWKEMAAEVQRLRNAWSHLGAIDRKDKKRLDQEFADALNVLQAPLEQQRKEEVGQREALIEAVGKLDPQDRHTLDAIRDIQQRWQQQAKAVPLERRAEQMLWQRFRAACDAVFASRKESAQALDAGRREHEAAKIAICQQLEAGALEVTPASAVKLLRDAASAWQAAGPVPRAHEARIEQRYQAAIELVQEHVDTVRRAVGAAQASALRDKLHLCIALEQTLAGDVQESGDWSARWTGLPTLGSASERALQQRFDAALAARAGGAAAQADYLQTLESNRATLLQDLLREEIVAGIDSGAEFARERLKLQVDVLQSSLKSGQKPVAQATRLQALLALPAALDERTVTRIEQLLMRQARALS